MVVAILRMFPGSYKILIWFFFFGFLFYIWHEFILSVHWPQNLVPNFFKDTPGISRINNFLFKLELFLNIWVLEEPYLTKQKVENIFLGYRKTCQLETLIGQWTRNLRIFCLTLFKSPCQEVFKTPLTLNKAIILAHLVAVQSLRIFDNFNYCAM